MIQHSTSAVGRGARVIAIARSQPFAGGAPVARSAAWSVASSVVLPGARSGALSRVLSRALSTVLLPLGRLLALGQRGGARDEPGMSVLRDLGLEHERPRSAFDWVGFHQGSESARLRVSDTFHQGWRGS